MDITTSTTGEEVLMDVTTGSSGEGIEVPWIQAQIWFSSDSPTVQVQTADQNNATNQSENRNSVVEADSSESLQIAGVMEYPSQQVGDVTAQGEGGQVFSQTEPVMIPLNSSRNCDNPQYWSPPIPQMNLHHSYPTQTNGEMSSSPSSDSSDAASIYLTADEFADDNNELPPPLDSSLSSLFNPNIDTVNEVVSTNNDSDVDVDSNASVDSDIPGQFIDFNEPVELPEDYSLPSEDVSPQNHDDDEESGILRLPSTSPESYGRRMITFDEMGDEEFNNHVREQLRIGEITLENTRRNLISFAAANENYANTVNRLIEEQSPNNQPVFSYITEEYPLPYDMISNEISNLSRAREDAENSLREFLESAPQFRDSRESGRSRSPVARSPAARSSASSRSSTGGRASANSDAGASTSGRSRHRNGAGSSSSSSGSSGGSSNSSNVRRSRRLIERQERLANQRLADARFLAEQTEAIERRSIALEEARLRADNVLLRNSQRIREATNLLGDGEESTQNTASNHSASMIESYRQEIRALLDLPAEMRDQIRWGLRLDRVIEYVSNFQDRISRSYKFGAKKVLTKFGISLLTNYDLKEEKKSEDCSVCLSEYKIGDPIIELYCKHIFHRDCITKWLAEVSSNCPLCRRDQANYERKKTQ